ncbi:hypothetical protein [Allocoleopsis franciscana]|nr:hypothetical protein [Allocoleopsis franciscana]
MTKLLNLPGVIVEDNQQTEDTLILFVKSAKKTAVCPRCGQTSRHLHRFQARALLFWHFPKLLAQ